MTEQVNDYRIEVCLELRSPVISASTDAATLGTDASPWLIQKTDSLYPALPGSLIQGNLRHSWRQLAEISTEDAWLDEGQINYWLGHEADQNTNNPSRAKLRRSDAWVADVAAVQGQKRYRIKVDELTGQVERGALQQIESPHPVGKTVNYVGWFECTCNAEVAKNVHEYISKGLEFVPALGGFKGIGFGVIKKADVKPPQLIENRHMVEGCEGDVFGMSLKLDRPLSFNQIRSQAGNRFESLGYIPGAAIKGALASRIAEFNDNSRWPTLTKYLDKVRFSHATANYREDAHRRSVPSPMNLYFCKHQSDANNISVGFVSPDKPMPEAGHIAFQSDWKSAEWGAVNQLLIADSDHPPARQLRVRTAIKDGAGIADEGRLFSNEVIEADRHRWLCDVSLTQVADEDRSLVKKELIDLLGRGINSLGKLDTCTTDIQVNAGPWLKTIAEKSVDSQQVSILLMSDARLFSDQNLDLKGANGGERLQEEYAKSWSLLSSGLLQLDSFYATQKLVGGDYYRRRFKQHEQPYNPWLVTCAGSVFYFQTQDVDACAKLLETWKESGVAVLPGVSEEWNRNPMVPANGYGEILINPVIETQAIQEVLNHG